MNKVLLLGGLAIASAALVYTLIPGQTQEPGDTAELISIREQVVTLRRQLSQLRERTAALEAQTTSRYSANEFEQEPGQAGLQSGDVILRYDNRRIFSFGEISTLSFLGELPE